MNPDEIIAKKIRDATDALNEALREASLADIQVDVCVVSRIGPRGSVRKMVVVPAPVRRSQTGIIVIRAEAAE